MIFKIAVPVKNKTEIMLQTRVIHELKKHLQVLRGIVFPVTVDTQCIYL